MSKLEQYLTELSVRLSSNCIQTQRAALIDIVQRITLSPKKLRLDLRKEALLPNSIFPSKTEDHTIALTYPLQMKRRGVETKLIIGGVSFGQPDPELIKLIARAREWYDGLKKRRYTSQLEIALRYNLDKSDVSRTLNLAFLSPTIISAILSGAQPADMTIQSLKEASNKLPAGWQDQAKFLRFTA